MTDKFYELGQDFDRFEDCTEEIYEDGYLEEFEGYTDLVYAFYDCAKISIQGTIGIAKREITGDGIWSVLAAQVPEKISVVAEPELLSKTDYPNIEYVHFWPIMSRRMVEALLSVKDFPHQIIPVTFKDFLGNLIECDYVILHLGQLSDVLDMEESIYIEKQSIIDPSQIIIGDIEKLRLKEPEGGFPPIFRVKWDEVSLYVSSEAKAALEAAGIQGLSLSRVWP
jgi:hypothetical protein